MTAQSRAGERVSPRHAHECKPFTSERRDTHRLLAVATDTSIAGLWEGLWEQLYVQELDDLKGWRGAVSFVLEFGDVAMPLLRSLFSRLSAAVSWLLVTLIGRSLGLVFRGVRESFGGRSGKQQAKGSA